ncbi:hypothetical protein ONS95_011610 [Cadophora gregata]|uniref:uncharacterized protein n=1 Tax=Cadophora gregata TaxID=51156 RepID=UPI0026DADFAC|nr:uncharacterized protein ONS95_011610 [Cadophora gregata]KAK0120204.1 hypothetical protein ONS95_011610 [Cadophora gregata]
MASAIIAACLPTLKPLVAKWFPRYFSENYYLKNQPYTNPTTQQHQQQMPRDRRRGRLSQEINYILSHQTRSDDAELQRSQATNEGEGTAREREIYDTGESLCSHEYRRKYFDLKDGKIVQINERFSALSGSFLSGTGHDSESSSQADTAG